MPKHVVRCLQAASVLALSLTGVAHADDYPSEPQQHRHHRHHANQQDYRLQWRDHWQTTPTTEFPTNGTVTTAPTVSPIPSLPTYVPATAPQSRASAATPTTTTNTGAASSAAANANAVVSAPTGTTCADLPTPSGGDDTNAINNVLSSVEPGCVVHAPGGNTWHYGNIIQVNGVTLQGDGDSSVFVATDVRGNPNMAIVLSGSSPALTGIKLTTVYQTGQGMSPSNGDGNGYRTSMPYSHLVYVARGTTGFTISSVHTVGGASGGIYSEGATGGSIKGNTVEYALSDGIGLYSGTSNTTVDGNTVIGCGDDGISVVSYTADKQSTGLVISNNIVSAGYWGRGITDVGGNGTIIKNNTVTNYFASGIWVAQDLGAGTYAPVNGTVDSNTVDHCVDPQSGYVANYEIDGPTSQYTMTNNVSQNPQAKDYSITTNSNVTMSGNTPAGSGA